MEFIPALKNCLEFKSAEGHSLALNSSALPVHPESPGCGFQFIKLQDPKSQVSRPPAVYWTRLDMAFMVCIPPAWPSER